MCVDLGISRVRGLFRKCFGTNSEVIFSFGFFVKRQVLSLREWPGLLVQVCLRFTGVSCLFVERAGSQVCRELSGGFVRERLAGNQFRFRFLGAFKGKTTGVESRFFQR